MRAGDGLIFRWPGRHHVQVILPAAIVLAAVAHVAIVFIFSIVYPAPQADSPQNARVFFFPPGTEEAQRLAALLPTKDPAVFAPGRGLEEFPVSVAYVPGYRNAAPPLVALPERDVRAVPAAPPVEPVPLSKALRPPTPRPAVATVLSATALRDRVPALTPGLVAPPGVAAEPAHFLVAVRPDGSVAHVFPQGSSGEPTLDRAAIRFLETTPFAAGGETTVWDFVTFHWGADPAP